jgi:hypothetical protein
VLEPTYEIIKSFEDGFARVKSNEKWGIINKAGKVVVNLEYEEVGNLFKNTTWARKGEVFGLVVANVFVPIDGVTKIWDFLEQDNTYAKKGDKIGFIDLKGKWIIEPKFDKQELLLKIWLQFS